VGHQSPRVCDEVPQLDEVPPHGKGLGCQKNALLRRVITTLAVLVDGVEPERWTLPHWSTK